MLCGLIRHQPGVLRRHQWFDIGGLRWLFIGDRGLALLSRGWSPGVRVPTSPPQPNQQTEYCHSRYGDDFVAGIGTGQLPSSTGDACSSRVSSQSINCAVVQLPSSPPILIFPLCAQAAPMVLVECRFVGNVLAALPYAGVFSALSNAAFTAFDVAARSSHRCLCHYCAEQALFVQCEQSGCLRDFRVLPAHCLFFIGRLWT